MKENLISILFAFLSISINAQNLANLSKSDDWRFAGGVTLYSNMTYPLEFTDYFHPLEFDFKYKLSDHNILRASIPLIWKRNIMGSTEVPHLPDKTTTLEQYVSDLHSIDNSGYYDPVNVIENYATVLGLALGYEYNFPLMNKLNFLGGLDIGYTYQYLHSRYFALRYYSLDANNQTTLYQISYNINDRYDNILNIKPFVGINYQFQKLMIEANIGYYYCTYFVNQKYQEKDSDAYNVIRNATPLIKNWTFSLDKINYKISLFYTL